MTLFSLIKLSLWFDTHSAMATCLILMFGRIGGVGGSNFVGLLLDDYCDLIFYLYSGLILSESRNIFFLEQFRKCNSIVTFYFRINRLRRHMLFPEHKPYGTTKDRGERFEMWGLIMCEPNRNSILQSNRLSFTFHYFKSPNKVMFSVHCSHPNIEYV